MADEKLINNSDSALDNPIDDGSIDYIQAINELKANTVEKSKYEASEAERKRLIKALVDGQQVTNPNPAEELPSRLECYKKYKENNFKTDWEYWDNFIKLRDATIKEYGKDPLVTGNYGLSPSGEKMEPEYGEAEGMQEFADNMKQLLEETKGDPELFTLRLGKNR